MRFLPKTSRAKWLFCGFTFVSVLACQVSGLAPATQMVEVTRLVRETQLVPMPTVEVTRLIPVAPIMEVTSIVVVTVEVPVEVEVPCTISELPTEALPAPTEAPPPAVPVPAPTEAPPPTAQEALSLGNDSLVWYNFEDDYQAAGRVADRSGNGIDAQVVGPVDVFQGLSGQRAIFFKGDSYIQSPVNPAASRTQVSFSLWFWTNDPGQNYKLASGAWWENGLGSGWILSTHAHEFWSVDMQSLLVPGLTNEENNFRLNEWNHEVVTYNGQVIREYTNGRLVNEWPTTGAQIGLGGPLVVGGWPILPEFNFVGAIDEFRIFGWALSLQEVQALYNRR
jgi:hypothetical protein